jgi:hypothetical protein
MCISYKIFVIFCLKILNLISIEGDLITKPYFNWYTITLFFQKVGM